MRKSLLVGTLLGAVLTVSCVNTLEQGLGVSPEQHELLSVVATAADAQATKTAIQTDGTSIYWTTGDAINLFYGSSQAGKFTTSISAPSQRAEFNGYLMVATGSSEVGLEAQDFWGVYPYNSRNTCDGTGVTLPIPTEQMSEAGTFADKLNPSIAMSSNLNLAFYNVCSWFIFTVTQEGVTSATFRGNDNEDIAGRVRVTMDVNHRPVAEVVEGAKSITLWAPGGGTFTPGKQYYMVLLPQTLEKGYTLTLHKGTLQAELVVSTSATFSRSSFRRKKQADEGLTYIESGSGSLNEIIRFADNSVKSVCVDNWDTNGDGNLSYVEAAAVTSLDGVFDDFKIGASFDEFQWFTGVSSLPEGLFQDWSNLTSIVLPPQITTLPAFVFKGCKKLHAIELPLGLTEIGVCAFEGCTALQSIDIPDGVTRLEGGTFYGCTRLVSVSFPEGLLAIGDAYVLEPFVVSDREKNIHGCFGECTRLASVELPDGLQSIGSFAFHHCKIKSLALPSSVTELGGGAFYNCTQLVSITMPGITNINDAIIIKTSVGGSYYSGSFSVCGCFSKSSISSIILPDGIQKIGVGAFRQCGELTTIIIPESVQEIGCHSFVACDQLTQVTSLPVIPPTVIQIIDCINKGGFDGRGHMFNDLISPPPIINVPSNSIEAYLDAWPIYKNYIQPIGGVVAVSSITLNQTETTLATGGTQQLTATVLPDNATFKTVTWSSSAADVATVSKNGLITALAPGTTTITAQAEELTATCTVTVEASVPFADAALGAKLIAAFDENGDGVLSYDEVAAATSLEGVFGTEKQFSSFNEFQYFTGITTIPNNLFSSWGLSSIVLPASITAIQSNAFSGCTGLTSITIPANVVTLGDYAFSSCTALTSIVCEGGTPATLGEAVFSNTNGCPIHVPLASLGDYRTEWPEYMNRITADGVVPAVSVSLDQTAITLATGDSRQLHATVLPDNASDKSVTWSSSNATIAAVSTTGVVTANTAGTATITVMTNDGGQTATCEVTVYVPVTSVSLDKTTLSMVVGETQQLAATILPENATDKSVTWSSGNESVATVSLTGVVTANAAGTATITVTTNEGGKTANSEITVSVPVTGIGLDNTALSMKVGDTRQLLATVLPDEATDKTVTWTSSAPAVAEVDDDGLITALAEGTTTITAQAGDKTATCTVTVNPEITIIAFADSKIKEKLVEAFDTDADGELSTDEAAAVSTIQGVFGTVTSYNLSFDEFQYFTGVIAVPASMFKNWQISSIVLPESITIIGASAFEGCTKLRQANIPASVSNIGASAFSGCSSLEAITLPQGLTTLGASAFIGCSALTEMTVPGTVTTVSSSAFQNCSKLRTLTIRQGVTTLSSYAFSGCTGLSTVSLPEGLTNISTEAFKQCSQLQSLTVPSSLVTIGTSAFQGCSRLTSMVIPNKVTAIGPSAFQGCSNLLSVTIPGSVANIGASAFRACTSLLSVTVPGSVTSLGDYVFEGCSSLSSASIPGINVPSYAFQNCTSLITVSVGEGCLSIGSNAFYGCSSLPNITIPESTTRIESNSFNNCSSLTEVTIPKNIVTIGQYAFQSRIGLNQIICLPTNPPSIYNGGYNYPFNNTNNCPIYVPAGSYSSYKAITYSTSFGYQYGSRVYALPE